MKEPVAGTMLRCQAAPWGLPGIGFQLQEWGMRLAPNGSHAPKIMAIAEPAQMKGVIESAQWEPRPETFTLAPDAAQVLMDDLWRSGIRPTEDAASAGQMSAVLKHLDDMRMLVFKKE